MKPYTHPYGGQAVDMLATREEVISRFGHDPAGYWAPNCKVLDVPDRKGGEVLVYSTAVLNLYRVTHVMR